ncbi:C69 family dipeptidase [Liquorilactobacillus ghanensis]|uniref:C69 family dipeptidase n=1 Tax=Liquorilactobacillus ghanensis TaxID=399370 RepID=UPI0039EA789E
MERKTFSACTSILVGRQATVDGSTMIARTEDAKTAWPKYFVVHPHQVLQAEPQFVSPDNGFTMTLPKIRGKYTATPEWTDKYGIFEESGINEYGVAMSATESAYANERVLGADPLVEKGIGEEAMVTITLPYIKSARAGVKYLGQLIEKYGASETNGVLFSDQSEVWYLEIATGHYWAAQRIPDNCYAVVANQLAIQNIDFNDPLNFLTAKGLKQFVLNNHLNSSRSNFNFREIFGTQDQSDTVYNTPRVWYGQRYFNPQSKQDPQSQQLPFVRQAERLIYREDLEYLLGSHYQGTVYDPLSRQNTALNHKFRPISLAKTQEAHILQLRPEYPAALSGLHWLALGVTAQSIFVPFYAGITQTPTSYQRGNATYSSDSAYWQFKLLGILVDAHYHLFGDSLAALQKEVRIQLNQNVRQTDQQAQNLSNKKLAEFLTQASLKNAAYVSQKINELTAELITTATALSPLDFKTDENL